MDSNKLTELKKTFPSLMPLNGKKPFEDGWQQWCETPRPFNIQDFHNRNAGIPCGPANGILVVDVDHIVKFNKICEANEWKPPRTRTHLTGTEKPHYIYGYPKNGKRYGNRSFNDPDGEIDPNTGKVIKVFDIRGIGGQVVAPGSTHPDTGKPYTVLHDIDIVPAPQWLLDLTLQEDTPQKIETPDTQGGGWDGKLESLGLSFAIKKLIREGEAKGGRSEAMGSVLTALLRAGTPEGTIFEIFNTYEIGAKYREKGNGKDKWLRGEIKRIQGFIDRNKKEPGAGESQEKKISMAIVLVEITKEFDLFHTEGDEVYAQYRANGHMELWNIRNKKFKSHISNIAYKSEGRMPSDNAIRDALNVIEGIARFDQDKKIEVHTRIARIEDTIYIDLVNDQWEVVEINKDGWDVIKTSIIYFERTKGMLPLPHPVPGGKISDLKELLNLPDDNDTTWILIVSWILQAMNDMGSYPILIVNGEQGSAKSTLSRLIRSIIDPNQAALRSLPRNEHDIVIAAKNGWVLGFDNLSGMQNWLSDALCRISTGAGFATRKLYSDNEEEIFYSRKPIILNGINSLVRRNDLADRAILISLPPIEGEGNIKESVLQKHFDGNLPSVLGGFYTAVAEGLKNKDMEFNNLPRMADFANWIQAAETALPWAKGRFIETYQENRASIIEESITQDLVGNAIKNWIDSWVMQTEWEGSTSDLLGILEKDMSDNTIRSKGWPQDASSLSRRLNSQTKFLRQTGIEIEKLTRNSKGQPLIIRKTYSVLR